MLKKKKKKNMLRVKSVLFTYILALRIIRDTKHPIFRVDTHHHYSYCHIHIRIGSVLTKVTVYFQELIRQATT